MIQVKPVLAALADLVKIVPGSTTLPILTNIRIKSVEMVGLTLMATNLDSALVVNIPGADSNFDVCVPAKTFYEVLRSIDTPSAEISIKDRMLLKAGGTKSHLAIQPGDEFPLTPLCEAALTEIKAVDLKRVLKKIVFAVSTDDSRPALQCVQIKNGQGKIVFTAADGFRLASQEIPGSLSMPANGRQQLLVPGAAIRKLIAMLPDTEETVSVSLAKTTASICFGWGGGAYQFYAQQSDLNFPAWESIVPAEFKATLDLPNDFGAAVRRADIFGRENSAHVVTFTPSEDGLTVSGSAAELGESRTTFNLAVPFKFAANAIFLQQGLEAIGGNVHMHLNGPTSPILLTNGSREYIYLVMPMATPETTVKAAQAAEASVQANNE